jgi:hypothetical protein
LARRLRSLQVVGLRRKVFLLKYLSVNEKLFMPYFERKPLI